MCYPAKIGFTHVKSYQGVLSFAQRAERSRTNVENDDYDDNDDDGIKEDVDDFTFDDVMLSLFNEADVIFIFLNIFV